MIRCSFHMASCHHAPMTSSCCCYTLTFALSVTARRRPACIEEAPICRSANSDDGTATLCWQGPVRVEQTCHERCKEGSIWQAQNRSLRAACVARWNPPRHATAGYDSRHLHILTRPPANLLTDTPQCQSLAICSDLQPLLSCDSRGRHNAMQCGLTCDQTKHLGCALPSSPGRPSLPSCRCACRRRPNPGCSIGARHLGPACRRQRGLRGAAHASRVLPRHCRGPRGGAARRRHRHRGGGGGGR